MENRRYKDREKFSYAAVFFLSLIPKLWVSFSALPLKTFSDEMATISPAAYLAGYDWSAVVSHAGYYGSGYHFMFAPLFMLTDNPVIIYRVVLCSYALLQAAIAPISYYLMKKYYYIEDKKFLSIASVACSYMLVTRGTLIFNEHILILCVWVMTFFLFRIQSNGENLLKKVLYTGILVLLLSYTLTIHTRAVALWIGLALLIVGYRIKYREWIVSRLCLFVFGGVGYISSQYIVRFVQGVLWKAGEGGELVNTSINLNTGVSWHSLRTWKAWLSIILGQLHTLNLITGGFGVLCIFLSLLSLARLFIKEELTLEEKACQKNDTIVYLFFGSCAAMTILGQSFTWLSDMSIGISHGHNSQDYGVKAVIYLRYFAVYLGPVFMACLCQLYRKKEKIKKYLLWAAAGTGILAVFWVAVILPFVYENPFTLEFMYSLSAYQVGSPVELKNYIIGMVWLAVLSVILYYLLKAGKIKTAIGVLCVFLIFQYCSNSMRYEVNRQEYNMRAVDGGYAYVKALEKTGEKIPKQLYCYDGSEKVNHQLFYAYQFFLNRYEIIPCYEKNGTDIPDFAVVLSNRSISKQLRQRGFQERKLDANEYLYYMDKKYN